MPAPQHDVKSLVRLGLELQAAFSQVLRTKYHGHRPDKSGRASRQP